MTTESKGWLQQDEHSAIQIVKEVGTDITLRQDGDMIILQPESLPILIEMLKELT